MNDINDVKAGTRWAFIAWWPHSRRSEAFARTLGGELHCIYQLQGRSRYLAPVGYVLQSLRTLSVLFRERPQAVHVQNPPFVGSLVVDFYCQLSGACFVIDHHSAAFSHVWNWARPVQRYLARRAVTNIVTNQHWADVVDAFGARALIMGDPFLPLLGRGTFEVGPGFNIAFVCTFSPDEPVDAVLEAAARLPAVQVYITGDSRRQPKSFFNQLPPNVTVTGFLPDEQYIALLGAVDAILVLTKRDYTLQLGGCEAVSAGQPLLTSDWPFLREFFPMGTIHVDNTSEGIVEGVESMQRGHRRLQEEMLRFRESARHEWNAQLTRLNDIVTEGLRI